MEERLSKEVIFHRPLAQLLVFAAIATYFIVFSFASIMRYLAFRALALDLGVYTQALWTALHGMFFYYTPDQWWNPHGLFFGLHFAPLMYLLLPIYAVYSQPQTLLVLQSLILGLAALPLYWIARYELKSYTLALVIVAMYLINPGIHSANLYDFHLEAFLPLFFLSAFYFFLTRKWVKYTIFIVLAMITIDYSSLIAVFFGLYWLIVNRNFIIEKLHLNSLHLKKSHNTNGNISGKNNGRMPVIMALATIVSATLVFAIGLKVISIYGPPPLVTSPNWPYLGSTFTEIVRNLFNPSAVVKSLTFEGANKVMYLEYLFAIVAFLPILAPVELVMALPWFMISLLSVETTFYSPGWQYFANVVPFLMIAAVYGMKRLRVKVHSIDFVRFLIALLAVVVILSVLTTPLNPSTWGKTSGAYNNAELSEHDALLESVIKLIPANASILTLNNIFPHVSNRADLYLWYPPSPPEYILYDVKSPDINDRIGNATSSEIISQELSLAQYGTVASTDGIVLMEKGYTGEPTIFQPFTAEYNFSNLIVSTGETIHDLSSISKVVLLHPVTSPNGSVFWYGPYVTLSPGWYQATFRLEVNSTNVGYVMTLDATAHNANETLAEQQVYGNDFPGPLTWTNITISFYVDQVLTGIEFRGVSVSNATAVYLDLIELQQIPSQ